MADIRAASVDDRTTLAGLLSEAGLPLAGFDETPTVLVAVDGRRVIGGIGLERYDIPGGSVFLLRSVVVAATERGNGVGHELVAAALRVVDRERADAALLTETASDYFGRFGFVRLDRRGLPVALAASAEFFGACPDTAVAMLRRHL